MGLEFEPVEAIDNRRAVAPYVAHDDAWRRCLAGRGGLAVGSSGAEVRIELNAMRRSVDPVADREDRAHPPRKAVLPLAVLHAGRVVAWRACRSARQLEK